MEQYKNFVKFIKWIVAVSGPEPTDDGDVAVLAPGGRA
jgi:hypothetical protein